jgi:hypothetical protein
MKSEPKYYKIPTETLRAIIGYLLNRPMSEVEAGVYALRNLEPLVEEEMTTGKTDDKQEQV